jgi:hypothetical protein
VKYFISLFCLVISISFVKAQSDTLSLFRTPSLNNKSIKTITYKNAINFNLMQIIRGGALLSYERSLANSGFALTAGVGINKFDAIGQVYFKELTYYYKLDQDVTKVGTKIKPLLDFGLKYYTSQTIGGAYFEMAFTMIKNTVNIQEFDYNQFVTVTANQSKLDYQSNELKLLFGFTNSNDNKFYHDFNLGLGYRFIQYEKYVLNETHYQTGSGSYTYEFSKKKATNETPWFFLSWKMGRRF